MRTTVHSFAKKMRAVGKRAKSVSDACERDLIEAQLDAGSVTVAMAIDSYLVSFVPGTPQITDELSRALTSSPLKAMGSAGEPSSADGWVDAAWAIKRFEERYPLLAVVVLEERILPKVKGDTYTAGVLAGEVVLVRTDSGEALCRVAFRAQSSAEVATTSEAGFPEAVRQDLIVQARSTLDAAVARMSPALNLRLD